MDQQSGLKSLLKPVVEGLGYVLWGLDYHASGRRVTLRIFVDRPEGGVTLEDCERVSRQVSAVLDVEDPITSRYTLEVSSPGWDRPLYEPEHYAAYLGEVLDVRLVAPFEGRRRFRGKLVRFEQNEVTLLIDDEEFSFPLESIDRANIVPQF